MSAGSESDYGAALFHQIVERIAQEIESAKSRRPDLHPSRPKKAALHKRIGARTINEQLLEVSRRLGV